jgi:hypothetical protein
MSAPGQNTIGCVTTETKPNSFGSGFATQGGGVYAMSWDTSGIAMWYFPRASVPSNIGGTDAPDPTTWGKASAWYPAASCDPTKVFGPQIITLVRVFSDALLRHLIPFTYSTSTSVVRC